MSFIQIKVEGLEKLKKALDAFPKKSAQYLGAAGREAAVKVILREEGLKEYPPMTAANAPPTPYYKRGTGMVYKNSVKVTSEVLSKQWYTSNIHGGFSTEIGNRASYAKWVYGEEQASFMAPKGWKKLVDVAKDKIAEITKVYDAWVDKLLKSVDLK